MLRRQNPTLFTNFVRQVTHNCRTDPPEQSWCDFKRSTCKGLVFYHLSDRLITPFWSPIVFKKNIRINPPQSLSHLPPPFTPSPLDISIGKQGELSLKLDVRCRTMLELEYFSFNSVRSICFLDCLFTQGTLLVGWGWMVFSVITVTRF